MTRRGLAAGLLAAVQAAALLLLAAAAAAQTPPQVSGVVMLPASSGDLSMVAVWWNADASATHFQVFIHPSVSVPLGGEVNTSGYYGGVAAANGRYRSYAVLQVVEPNAPYYYSVRGGRSPDPTDGTWGEWSPVVHHDGTFMGDGHVRPVDGDHPAEALGRVRDYGLENAPVAIAVIGAVFTVGSAFWLVRRGLIRSRQAMRL